MYVAARNGLLVGELISCFVRPEPVTNLPIQVCDSGSAALRFAVRHLGVGSGGTVLVPAYVCDSVPAAVEQEEMRPRYYPVSEQLEPQWDALEKLAAGCKAVVVVHYFGFPQDMNRWLAFAHRHKLKIIEDCAHALGASFHGRPLGTIGDCGIYSLKKFLPCPEGGGVFFPGIVPVNPPPSRPWSSAMRGWIRMMLTGLSSSVGVNLAALRGTVSVLSDQQLAFGTAGISAQSPIIQALPGVQFLAQRLGRRWKAIRQRNYELLFNELSQTASEVAVHRLVEGAVPVALPLLVNEMTAKKLVEAGIGAYCWPRLPRGVPGEFPEAAALARRMVLLPVHQNLSARKMKRIGRIAAEIIRGGEHSVKS